MTPATWILLICLWVSTFAINTVDYIDGRQKEHTSLCSRGGFLFGLTVIIHLILI